jgi:hypothetical protein
MDYFKKLIGDIECHSVEGIEDCFRNGVDPNALYNDKPLFYELTSEYTRGPAFKECVRAFIRAGLNFDKKQLLAVLADDPPELKRQINSQPDIINEKFYLRCAYTPLLEVTLLHICAEFNHIDCAKILINNGADINARAGNDENGFGGQTPIFHTVNQNGDHSSGMMSYLLSLGTDLHITVPGIIWGNGYPWETLIPSVNPISYAMMGMLPQMHRNEKRTSEIVSQLIREAYGIEYVPGNIPNAYLSNDFAAPTSS